VSKINDAFDNILDLTPHISQNERATITSAIENMLNLQKRIPFIGSMMGDLAENAERKAPRVGKYVPKFDEVEKRAKTLKSMLLRTKSLLSSTSRGLEDVDKEYAAANADIQKAEVSVAIFEAMMKRTEKNFNLIEDVAIPFKDIVAESGLSFDIKNGIEFEGKEDHVGLNIINAVEEALPKLITFGYSIAAIAKSPDHSKKVESLRNSFVDLRAILKKEFQRIRSEHKNAVAKLNNIEFMIELVENVQNLDEVVEDHHVLREIKRIYDGIPAKAKTYHDHLVRLKLSEERPPAVFPPPTTTRRSVPSVTKTTTASTTTASITSTTTASSTTAFDDSFLE
jgi:uncharacterized coiled-coil DUF342 family protein